MAIIYSYQENEELRNSDMLVGTASTLHNGQVRKITKNFSLGELKTFINGGDLTLSNGGTSGPATLIDNILNIPVYQGALTLTTTGSTGAATLIGNTLNIPVYTGGSPTIPTLDEVLNEGNTSLLDAKIGVLYLYDDVLMGYGGSQLSDNVFSTYTKDGNPIFSADPTGYYGFYNGLIEANLVFDSITAFRQYQFPDASGTIALTSDIPSLTGYVQTTRTISTTSPLQGGGDLSANRTLSILQSGTSQDGYLSLTDWNTFNNKQNSITLTTTGSGAATFISNVLNIPTPPTATFTSLTTIGSSGSSTLIGGVLNVPTYTLAGLGGVPTSRTLTINGTAYDLSTDRSWSVGTVISVGLSMPSAFNVSNSPVTGSGTIAVTGAGVASQYIRGDGTLANFPTSTGGGASVSYYLNGSVSQGTIGGVAYKEMNSVPIIGAGTDFTINTDGYIAQFITDAGDPNKLLIPGGNWNFETYFSASSGGGSPSFYIELYKYDGTIFTLIASNSTTPRLITDGTNIEAYFSSLAVPETILLTTDRLAVRFYVIHSGRTITMHTENSHLCQVITTFSTGITALNGLTSQVQYFAVGTSGTDFNISSVTDTHTFNLPTASAINRGALSSTDWSTFNGKQNAITLTVAGNSGSSTLIGSTLNIPTYTLTGLGGQPQLNGTGFVKALGTTISYDNTTYYPNPTGTTAQYVRGDGSLATFPTIPGGTVTSVAALTLGTSGTDLSSTVANPTTTPVITLNVPTASATNRGALSSADWTTFNSKFTLPSLTNGSVLFSNGTTIAENNANFFWDNSNSRLGLGTITPSAKLHVDGSMFLLDSATGVSTITFPNGPQIEANGPGGYFKSGLVHSSLSGPTAGNVGIGTTSPTDKLDVSGVIRGVLPDPSGLGGITAKLLSYSPSPYGMVFRGYSTGAHSIQVKREANDVEFFPLILQPSGSNVGIGTTSPSAKLDVNGDALINGITVGRGAGNDASNTIIGNTAFINNTSGQENVVIGYVAGDDITTGTGNVIIGKGAGGNVNTGDGNTIIGTNNSLSLTGSADFSDTLSISKGESNYGTFLPHIWAPAVMSTSSTATIISAAAGSYRAMFVEYVIEDENGNIRGGYIKGIWNNDLSVIKMTEDTTSSIGVTSDYVFDIINDGYSNAALQITSLSADIVYCAVTSRLLTKVY